MSISKKTNLFNKIIWPSILLTLALASCAKVPAKLTTPKLRNDVPLAELSTTSQNNWPTNHWWQSYKDHQLNQLMNMAAANSPDLAQAQSRVHNAEQSVQLAAAQAGLRIQANMQLNRQRLSEHGMIPPKFLGFTWYNQADLNMQFQYVFDWWGQKRAAIEAALDQAYAAEAQSREALLTIQNAVAETYFGWLADCARSTLMAKSVAIQQQLLHIAQQRVAQGIDLPGSIQQAQDQLATAQQAQTAVDQAAQIRKVALAALLGISPAKLPPLMPHPLPKLRSGLPAHAKLDLIARRPDIAVSRWLVDAALHQTEVARVQFLPNISLTALAGLSSTDRDTSTSGGNQSNILDHLFSRGARIFSLAPAIHLPIFESGQLQANYGISRAQLQAAIAQYNRTVISAARDVSTQVVNAERLATQLQQQTTQIKASQQLYAMALARLRQGISDARESLTTQAQLLQKQDTAIILQTQAITTDLALIKALGGGYRSTYPVAKKATKNIQGNTHEHD